MAKKTGKRREEPWNKTKESWKGIVEWGKEFFVWGFNTIKEAYMAILYDLLSIRKEWAASRANSKWKKEWITKKDAREFERKAKEHQKKAEAYKKKERERIKKANKEGKRALKWWWKGLKNIAYWIHHSVDTWDKWIWEKIEERETKHWKKSSWEILETVKYNIMKTLAALWIAWFLGFQWWKYVEDRNKDWIEVVVSPEEVKDSDDGESATNNTEASARTYTINVLGDKDSSETIEISTWEYEHLKNKKITTKAPLTRRYLWWDLEKSGDLEIWDKLTLNSAESLHILWTKKIQDYGQFTKSISELDAIDTSSMNPKEIESFRVKYPIDATYLFTVKPYVDWKETKDRMTLKEFMEQTNQIVKEVKSDTESYSGKLTWSKKDLFDAVRNGINWESIVAYAMTELCENKENWEFNKELFDLLLRNAGTNYLSYVPAIYDWKTSYWLYQFTEYALYDRNWEKRWASLVNQFLPEWKKIPWSVIDLKTRQDQTKAAYMFALYNLNKAVSKLTNDEAKSLLQWQKTNKVKFKDNMTQLIAMCHHRPADASALKEWHKAKCKNDIYNYGKAQTYGKASKNNYEALRK